MPPAGYVKRREANRAYMPMIPGLVGPAGKPNPAEVNGTTAFLAANRINATRVIVPEDGILHDFLVFIGGTSPAHCRGLIYDTGEANPGSRTKLWDGGSIAAPAINAWANLGDPSLTVYAGQHLDFAVQSDDTAGLFGRMNTNTSGAQTLPSAFVPVRGGALPKFVWSNTPGSFTAPATIAEASVAGTSNLPLVILARVVPA